MKNLSVRAIAWILLILLALSCILPALAADTDARTVTTLLGDGLTLTQMNSLTGSTRRQQFTLDFDPEGSVKPLVLYGDTLYGKSTIEAVVQYAQDQGHHVLAAVNADYFSTANGVPTGMTIQDGRLVTSDGGWNAFGFRKDGTAVIGHPELTITVTTEEGDALQVAGLNKVRDNKGLYLYTPDFDYCTRTSADGVEVLLQLGKRKNELAIGKTVEATVLSVEPATNTQMESDQMVLSLTANNTAGLDLTALLEEGDEITIEATTADELWEEVVWGGGGGNILVKDGVVTGDANASGREPRTVLGVRKDGSVRVIVCDGRQSALSAGMTLSEAANLLLNDGCRDVINLDGGGSTVLTAAYPGLDSAVLSSPSDGKPREGATYLLFTATGSDQGRSYGSVVYPRTATVLCGDTLELSAVSYNKNFLGFLDVTDELEASDGEVEDGVFYAPDTPGRIEISTGDSRCQSAYITVTDHIETLNLTKNDRVVTSLSLERRESVQLGVQASDGLAPIQCDQSLFSFSVEGNVGSIDEDGLFTAGNYAGTGAILVHYGRQSASIPVTIAGKTSQLLEGFESGQGCGTFGSALSSVQVLSDLSQARYGEHALKMTYEGIETDAAEYLFSGELTLNDASHLSLSAKGTGTWGALFLMEDGGVSISGFAMSGEGWRTASLTVPDGAQTLLGFVCQGAGKHTLLVDHILAHHGALNLDDLPPALELTLSEDGLTLTGTITDAGEIAMTKNDIALLIDGAPAAFTFEKGVFTAALPADGGLHRISLTAKDAIGNLARQSWSTGTVQTTFADMNGHWAAANAEYLLQKGVFSPSDKFNPSTKVSNEMAATMLSRFLGVDTSLYADVELPYADAAKIGDWALPHVKAMYALGIMQGSVNANGVPALFPKSNCSRAQIMTILGRTLYRGYSYSPCTYADANTIPAWARDHIDLLTHLGVVGGSGDKVNPLGTITRAEFAALLYRMY